MLCEYECVVWVKKVRGKMGWGRCVGRGGGGGGGGGFVVFVSVFGGSGGGGGGGWGWCLGGGGGIREEKRVLIFCVVFLWNYDGLSGWMWAVILGGEDWVVVE